jgi:glycopeptide antibiotics resistance protein
VTNAALPAVFAVFLGLLLAVALFTPFAAVAYRRYGRLTVRHTVIWLGFLIYALAVWCYTLLPLPDPARMKCAGTQLRPFYFVTDFLAYPHGSLGEVLRNPVLAENGLNVALFLPLGFFMRALFNRGVACTAFVGASMSMFVELTQLTGVWGIYPCAYRVFDVDDLIANTAGAALGAVAALLVPRHLVSARRLPPGQPAPVTKGRRVVAMAADGLTVAVLDGAVSFAGSVWLASQPGDGADSPWAGAVGAAAFAAPFAVQGLCVAVSGRTVGDIVTELRLEPARPAWLARRLTRFLAGIGGFQLLGLLPAPWHPVQWVFAVVALVAAMAAPRARSLPGLIARQTLVDVRGARAGPPAAPPGNPGPEGL